MGGKAGRYPVSSVLWATVGFLGAVLLFLSLLVPLLHKDLEEGVPWLAGRLVRRAARKLPVEHQRRFEEEWLAELMAIPGGMVFQLRFASVVLLQARSMSRRMPGLPPIAASKWAASAWREDALARAAEMSTLLLWLKEESKLDNKAPLVTAVQAHLQAARQGAHEERKWVLRTRSGAIIERTLANLHAAYINLLRLAPPDYLQSNIPNLLVQAREQLGPDDPRLRQLELLAGEANRRKLEHPERNAIVAAIQGAAEHERRAHMRARSFRRRILFMAVILLAAVIIGAVIFFHP